MLNDIWTVVRKETREIINMRDSRRGTFLAILIPAFILGIQFPLQFGENWAESPMSLMTWVMVPIIFVSTIIADSFAGERERHTLDTLLSTRLSEKAILLGKISAAILYALSVTLFVVLLGFVTAVIAHGKGSILMFSPLRALTGAALGFLAGSITANAGTLVSLRASTVKQAQQTLGIAMMFVFFSPTIIVMTVPKSTLKSLKVYLGAFDLKMLVILVIAVLVAVDGALLLWAMARFKRNRMMVE